MKLAFAVPAQADKLRAEAERLGLLPEDLARAAMRLPMAPSRCIPD